MKQDVQQFETIRPFAKNIFTGNITLSNVDKYQSNLLIEFIKINGDTKTRYVVKKTKKRYL